MTRILSLDDEPAILKLLGVSLELAGYEHSCTTDGHQALRILYHEQIDLLTQDIMRPKMDGWELYRLMKSDAELRKSRCCSSQQEHKPIVWRRAAQMTTTT